MIYNLTNKTVLSRKTLNAISFRDRLQGMIGRKFNSFDAIVFYHCSAIHTFFMSYPIDVIFLSAENEILKSVSACKPWKFAISCKTARCVIELPEGTLAKTATKAGDKLDLNAEITQKVKNSFFSNTILQESNSALSCNQENSIQ